MEPKEVRLCVVCWSVESPRGKGCAACSIQSVQPERVSLREQTECQNLRFGAAVHELFGFWSAYVLVGDNPHAFILDKGLKIWAFFSLQQTRVSSLRTRVSSCTVMGLAMQRGAAFAFVYRQNYIQSTDGPHYHCAELVLLSPTLTALHGLIPEESNNACTTLLL